MQSIQKLLLALIIVSLPFQAYSQKIGLVLSGGGAKGLAHVGVLKALEEHHIPIDYIVGTSMGGVVGGFYAAGYSPEEIEVIARSKRFQEWINGDFPEDFNTYYYEEEPSPKWLEVSLGVDSTFDTQFKPQLAQDAILNFAIAEYTAAANRKAKNNFDSLFVPFKAIGAEIFTQKVVRLDSGNLGASLRATMSVPFVYKPVKIDREYIFDGGVYENFPALTMKDSYSPDFMIGVNVSTRVYEDYPDKEAEKLISSSLLYLILDKADPKQLGENSQYIEPNLASISGFDFAKVDQIIDSGYQATIKVMPELLKKVQRRKTKGEVMAEREAFVKQSPLLTFSEIKLDGFRGDQERYVKRNINPEQKKVLTLKELKYNYFKLVADPYFSNVFPRILYREGAENYSFQLSAEKGEKLRLQVGGNIANTGLSNFFIGAKFDHLNHLLFNHRVSVRIGEFYKSFEYRLKMHFPFSWQFDLEPFFVTNGWDYLGTGNFLANRRVVPINQTDRNYGVKLSTPVFNKMKLSLTSSLVSKTNEYSNALAFLSSDTLDENAFAGLHHLIELNYSSLNNRLFPSKGTKYLFGLSHNYGEEKYQPGSTSETPIGSTQHQWFKVEAYMEKYYPLKYGDFGFDVKAALSSMNAFSTLRGTLINSPAYNPTFESRGLYLENFRAPAYIAGGVKYQVKFIKEFHFRAEAHVFKPFTVWQTEGVEIQWSALTPEYRLAAMAALYYKTPVGPISLSAHYYEDDAPFLFLFNIGFLMFNEKPLE